MNRRMAFKACRAMGDGWRLPTIEELKKIYELKGKIGGFYGDFYWSSMNGDILGLGQGVWFYNGQEGTEGINVEHRVRPVRDLK